MKFFDPAYGLKAWELAAAVQDAGPLLRGADGRFWAYADGVWSPANDVVHGRIVRLLRDRYRPHHKQAVVDVLLAELDLMHVRPAARFINVRNGLIVWAGDDGPTLLEHMPESESTVQLPIAWNEDARCPEFDRFLAEAVAEDDQDRVWEILGYLMMSGNPLQRLFLLTGGGGNGKGVLLDVIKALLGYGNVSSVPLHDFAESRFATAELVGKLANVCGDIDTTYIEKTGQIKQLAGEDSIKAERKNGQPFSFEFWGKMIFSANAIPVASDSSTGWLRRWEIVHFPNAPAAPDLGLKRRLTQPGELEGIALRAVRALPGLMLRRTFSHGLSAHAARQEFAERNNLLIGWLADDDHGGYPDPGSWYPRKVLYSSYRGWYVENNPSGRVMGTQTFYERLRQIRGVIEKTRNGTRGFAGLRLNRDAIHVDLTTSESAPSDGVHPSEQGTLWG